MFTHAHLPTNLNSHFKLDCSLVWSLPTTKAQMVKHKDCIHALFELLYLKQLFCHLCELYLKATLVATIEKGWNLHFERSKYLFYCILIAHRSFQKQHNYSLIASYYRTMGLKYQWIKPLKILFAVVWHYSNRIFEIKAKYTAAGPISFFSIRVQTRFHRWWSKHLLSHLRQYAKVA